MADNGGQQLVMVAVGVLPTIAGLDGWDTRLLHKSTEGNTEGAQQFKDIRPATMNMRS